MLALISRIIHGKRSEVGMIKDYDFSTHDDYYSQVNNQFMPQEACMPTSFIMALIYNKIPVVPCGSPTQPPCFFHPKSLQPEDYLMAVCNSPWGIALRNRISWAAAQKLAPNQVHAVISDIVNELVGRRITKFETNKNIENLSAIIKQAKSVVVSGSFTAGGHAVVVCGLREVDGKTTHFLVDDPYGNYFTGYNDRNGNNVLFPVEEFDKLWAHWYHVFDAKGV
jgi:hypothetical protein